MGLHGSCITAKKLTVIYLYNTNKLVLYVIHFIHLNTLWKYDVWTSQEDLKTVFDLLVKILYSYLLRNHTLFYPSSPYISLHFPHFETCKI